MPLALKKPLSSSTSKFVTSVIGLLQPATTIFSRLAGGAASVAKLKNDADAVRFVNEAYRHCKPIAASAAGIELLKAAAYPGAMDIMGAEGVVTSDDAQVDKLATDFIAAMAQHRFWNRELKAMPA